VRSSAPNVRRVVILVWRDTRHPDGGGSEVYVEHMARYLAAHGHDVIINCAAHPNAPADEVRDGVRYRRRGSWLGVYPRGLAFLASKAGRRADVVIDVHNGLPFLSPLVRGRTGRFVLVHHVHREQWQIIYPGARGRVGWWIESRLSPWLYRNTPYLTVSESTKRDLRRLGVATDIDVIYNGIDVPHPTRRYPRSASPRICCVSRLVPHKQIEHALSVMAELRNHVPGLELDIVGDGWWSDQLKHAAQALGVTDVVTFHGYVPDDRRDELVDRSWLMLAPSVKEGWGISIMEAAARGVPTIAYRSAGGVSEAIVDGETGLLVDDLDDMVRQARRLLVDEEERLAMGKRARGRAQSFSWERSCEAFERRILPLPSDAG